MVGKNGAGAGSRRIAFNAALQAVAEVVGKVATLALTVVAARSLSQEDFGAFAYALAFAPLVAVLWSWGLGVLLIQEASKRPEDLPRLYAEFIFLRSFLVIPAVIIFGAVGAMLRPDTESAIVLVVVLIAWAINSFREANMSAGVARQEMVGVMKAQVADRLATAGLGIGALLLGLGVVALGVAFLLGSLVGYLVARRAIRDLGIHLDLRRVDRRNLFPMFKRSFYIGLDTMVSQFLFRFDAVILSAVKGDAVLAAYSVAYRLLETVLFISWAIARALFPSMSAGGPERVRRGIEEGVAALAVVYVPFGVMLFMEADRLIPFLFGSDYGSASAEVAQWLAAAPLLFGISYLAGYGLQSLARSRDVLIASSSAAVCNIGLNLVLIPRYAGTGAAMATSAAYALESIVSLWMLAPTVGWPRLGRRLLAPVIASVVMAVVIGTMPGHVLLTLAAAGVVYLLCWYPLARRTAPEQITVISSLIPGRFRR